MRIFKTKAFDEWARKIKLTDIVLKQVIDEVEQGRYEAALGGCLYKKRIALSSKGKRSGARAIIAVKTTESAFYIYGFAKNKRANISDKERIALKKLAKIYFTYTDNQLKRALEVKEFVEVLP